MWNVELRITLVAYINVNGAAHIPTNDVSVDENLIHLILRFHFVN